MFQHPEIAFFAKILKSRQHVNFTARDFNYEADFPKKLDPWREAKFPKK